MAEQINHQPCISLEEALRLEIIINQALIDILMSKEIISEEELIAGMQKIRWEREKILNSTGHIVSLKRQT